MTAYPEYKSSRVQWLGDIPSHWNVSKLKHKISCNDSTLPESYDGSAVIKYVEISDVSYENGITNFTELEFKDAPSRARRITQKNDVIISTVRTYLKAIAKIESDDLIVSTGFAVLRPNDIDPTYLYYALSTSGFLGEVESHSTGVSYPAITANELINLEIPLPLPNEQKNIAEYLNEVTGRVDALIAEKKKQIKDLHTYRIALITETVTHGLNPDVPFRDLKMDWIGKIPEHWNIAKFKYAIHEIKDGTHFSPEISDYGYPYVTATDIRGVGIDYSKTKKISEDYFLKLRQAGCEILKDDVLLVKDGATTGRVGYKDDDTLAVTLSSVAILRTDKSGWPKFLMYLLESSFVQAQISDAMAGAAMPRITLEKLGNFICLNPPLNEQKEIAVYLYEKTERIDRLIAELEKQLDDLELYKKTVITEAVTGKVDVRDWVPKN